jgi:hypothetical protein
VTQAIMFGINRSRAAVPLPSAPNAQATIIPEAVLNKNPIPPLTNFNETFFKYSVELFIGLLLLSASPRLGDVAYFLAW